MEDRVKVTWGEWRLSLTSETPKRLRLKLRPHYMHRTLSPRVAIKAAIYG
jgi:hypothetical protein